MFVDWLGFSGVAKGLGWLENLLEGVLVGWVWMAGDRFWRLLAVWAWLIEIVLGWNFGWLGPECCARTSDDGMFLASTLVGWVCPKGKDLVGCRTTLVVFGWLVLDGWDCFRAVLAD